MKNKTDEFSFLLKPSTVHGVGVFAAHDISKGTKLMLKPENYTSRKLKDEDRPEAFKMYCVKKEHEDFYRCPSDFSRMEMIWFLNNSDKPNAEISREDWMYYALRDMKEGEEILIDYDSLKN